MRTSKFTRVLSALTLATAISIGFVGSTPAAFAGGLVPTSLKQAPPEARASEPIAPIDMIEQIGLLFAALFL
jgi:hypothetical protein